MLCSRHILTVIIFLTGSSLFLQSQPLSGPAAWWPFNGNADDASGNGHDGTLHGPRPTIDRFGRLDSAYSFDGIDDYIEIPGSSGLNLDVGTGITFSFWVQVCSPFGPGVLMEHAGGIAGPAGDSGWSVGIVPFGDRTSSPAFLWQTTTQGRPNPGRYTYDRTPLKPSLDDRKWHHLAIVLQPTSIKFYVDGKMEASMSVDSVDYCCYTPASPLRIGAGGWDNQPAPLDMMKHFQGALDDIRVYDRGLSDTEVRSLYQESGWPIDEPTISLEVQRLTPTQICDGGEVQVRVTHDGNRLVWNTLEGVVNPGDEVVTIRPAVTTTYRVRAYRPTSGYPCPDTISMVDSFTVSVLDPPRAKAGDSLNLAVCVGNSIALGGQTNGGVPPYTWNWMPSDGLDDSTSEHPMMHASVPGRFRYLLVVTDAKGCTDTSETFVVVSPAPIVITGPDTIYSCREKGTVLSVRSVQTASPHTYSWSPSAGLDRTDTSFVIAAPETATRYILTVESASGCRTFDTVTVIPSPSAIDIGNDTLICPGTALTIGTPAQPGVSYQWTPASGVLDPTSSRILVTPTTSTVYKLSATDPRSGCTVIDSINVLVNDAPLSVDLNELDFGLLSNCSTDSTISIRISNHGTMPAWISEWSVGNSAFELVDTTFVLPAKRTVAARVRFVPQEDGLYEDTLTIVLGACAQTLAFPARGEKRTPRVDVVPPALDFGGFNSCDPRQSDTTVAIFNAGASPIVLSGAISSPQFTVTAPAFPIALAPGERREIALRYMPAGRGNVEGNLEVSYESAGCFETLQVPLTALVEEPRLQAATAKIDFGILEGCALERDTTVRLHNPTRSDITLTGADVPEGYQLLTALPVLVPANGGVDLGLRFLPPDNARFDGTLLLKSEPCAEALAIDVGGEKMGVWSPLPDTIDFGEVVMCADAGKTLPLALRFDGDGQGSVRLLSVTGPFGTTLAQGTILPAGVERTFDVEFTPAAEGEFAGEIAVVLEPCGLEHRIAIRGTATRLELSGSDQALAVTSNAAPLTAEIVFRNTGSAVALVDRVEGILPPFALLRTTPALPAELAPDQELRVIVRYSPGPDRAYSPVQAVMTAPCPMVSTAKIYADGIPGPGAAEVRQSPK